MDVTLFLSLLTSSAGQPEQSVSFLDSREPLWYKRLCHQAMFSCWLIFLMYKQTMLSSEAPISKQYPMYSQNEVPEGVRATYHSKVSPLVSVEGHPLGRS